LTVLNRTKTNQLDMLQIICTLTNHNLTTQQTLLTEQKQRMAPEYTLQNTTLTDTRKPTYRAWSNQSSFSTANLPSTVFTVFTIS